MQNSNATGYIIAPCMNFFAQKMEALEQVARELTAGSHNDKCEVNVHNSVQMS